MQDPSQNQEWRRLISLLGPVHDQVRATARRLGRSNGEGDDLFQESVLRALHNLPHLRDESRFKGWFHAILLSIHRTRSRRSFWRRFFSLEESMLRGFDPPGEDGEEREEERWRAERASRALAILPAVQREAVVLFELEGYSIEEVAEMQKVSISAVKSRLARGRERLRRHYEKLGLGTRLDIGSELPPPSEAGGASGILARAAQVVFPGKDLPATETVGFSRKERRHE